MAGLAYLDAAAALAPETTALLAALASAGSGSAGASGGQGSAPAVSVWAPRREVSARGSARLKGYTAAFLALIDSAPLTMRTDARGMEEVAPASAARYCSTETRALAHASRELVLSIVDGLHRGETQRAQCVALQVSRLGRQKLVAIELLAIRVGGRLHELLVVEALLPDQRPAVFSPCCLALIPTAPPTAPPRQHVQPPVPAAPPQAWLLEVSSPLQWDMQQIAPTLPPPMSSLAPHELAALRRLCEANIHPPQADATEEKDAREVVRTSNSQLPAAARGPSGTAALTRNDLWMIPTQTEVRDVEPPPLATAAAALYAADRRGSAPVLSMERRVSFFPTTPPREAWRRDGSHEVPIIARGTPSILHEEMIGFARQERQRLREATAANGTAAAVEEALACRRNSVEPKWKDVSEEAEVAVRRRLQRRDEMPPVCLRCHHCGTTDTGQWRRGPNGPLTLCNKCGIRWRREGVLG